MSENPAVHLTPSLADDAQALSFLASRPAFLSSDDAAACLHGLLKARRNIGFNGFILKNREGRFVCAQQIEALAASAEGSHSDTANDESGMPVVTITVMGALIVQSGFSLEASFHARPTKAQGADESTTEWVQRNRFFSIADLSAVMSSHRKYSKCYLSACNGGLLLYASSQLPFEQELAPRLTRQNNGQLRRFEALYEDGSIPSSLWILLTLAAGAVKVVVAGDLWRRRGKLNVSWRTDILQMQPAIESMPIFGPILANTKAVSVYLRSQLAASVSTQSSAGFILKHHTGGFFIVTEPVSGHYASFGRAALFPKDQHGNPLIPREFRVYGIYYAIAPLPAARKAPSEADLQQNFFSVADLKLSLEHVSVAPHQRLFALTPDGAVLRFSKPIMSKVRVLISELTQGLEQKIIAGDMTLRTLVDKVADAGIFGVMLPSKTWPDAGRITVSTTAIEQVAQ